MKKMFLLLTSLLLSTTMYAQNYRFEFTEPYNKSFNYLQGYRAQILSDADGQVVIASRKNHKIGMITTAEIGNIFVCIADKELNILRQYVIENSHESLLAGASATDNGVFLLLSSTEEGVCTYTRVVLDRNTLDLRESRVEARIACGDTPYVKSSTARSTNGDYNAELLTVATRQKIERHLLVFTDEMELLWQRLLPRPVVGDLYVSDQGIVYLSGYNNQQNVLYFAKITEDDDYFYEQSVDRSIYYSELVNVVDDCILVCGSYQHPDYLKTDYVGGLFAMSFNMTTGKMRGIDYHDITPDEELVLNNEGSRYRAKGYAPLLNCSSTAATTYGGVAVFSADKMMYTNGLPSAYVRKGLVVVGINAKGEFVWTCPLRHLEQESGSSLCGPQLLADGDNLTLIKIENPKYVDTYSIFMQEKLRGAIANANKLAAYTFSADGQVTKYTIAPKVKALVGGSSRGWLGSHAYYLTSSIRKSSLLTIER